MTDREQQVVPLPAPDTHCFDEDAQKDCWSHSAEQLLAYGNARAAAAEARIAELERDAGRYRWLRSTLHQSVGGGVEVNDQKLVYEEPEPGEAVRVFWYPNTPIGFYEHHADTLDAAIDAAMQAQPAPLEGHAEQGKESP